jgi:hypothetical protein
MKSPAESSCVLAGPSSGSQSGFWESDWLPVQSPVPLEVEAAEHCCSHIVPLEGSPFFCGTWRHSLICLLESVLLAVSNL